MTVEELNALVDRAYAEAFAFEGQLALIYEDAFARVGAHASRQFSQQAVVAAGFVSPPPGALSDGLTEKEQKQANEIRDRAAEAVAAILVTLGLAEIASSFMEAIAQRGSLNFEQEVTRVLKQVIQDAVNEGWSVAETAKEIQRRFRDVSVSTSQMLAQTELTTLVNERSLQAATVTSGEGRGPLYKRWETMRDGRVRVAHAATQGQTVPVSQPFDVGGYSMMYPGDTSAPMQLVARCRCRMSYSDSLTASAQEVTLMDMNGTNVSYGTATWTAGNSTPFTTITICVDDEQGETESVGEDATEPGEEPSDVMPMADGPGWKALLAVEGVPTEDGRMLAEGSLTWRDLPLSLTAMDTSAHGDPGPAKVAGRIDKIWRDGSEVWGSGVFNTDEFGTHIYELVSNQSLRGNSIEPAVVSFEVWDRETMQPLSAAEIMDAQLNDRPLLTVFTEAIIMCSTVVATPAIGEANIMLSSGLIQSPFFIGFAREEDGALTASAAGLAPLKPPVDWFSDPGFNSPTPLTVTSEGRLLGHAALWNSCHIAEPHGPGVCVPPPRSGMQYSVFHHGVVETEEGVEVPCGQVTMSTLHASRDLGWKAALEHYEHSGCAVADVVAGEDRFGIWVSGGLRPDLPATKVRELKAGALSGDWRDVIGRGLEFLAALVVNIPGFPIPRPEARIVASAAGEEQVLAIVAAGIVTEDDVDPMPRREYLRKMHALTDEPLRDYSAAERKRMAGNGQALPDGSFPIANCSDAANAIRSVGRASDPGPAKAHIRKRVKALGCSGGIYDNWK